MGVFWGLCEEVEALCGMCTRERRLKECRKCMGVLKMCIFILPLAYRLLHLLAKPPKHDEIRLLRQQHRSTVFASAGVLPYARTRNATS